MRLYLPIHDITEFAKQHNCCYTPEQLNAVPIKRGTALDVLKTPGIPDKDKIWFLSREGAMPEQLQRLCAVAFVRETPLLDGRKVSDLLTDPRSIEALYVAERHALGGTGEELAEAFASAGASARATDWATARGLAAGAAAAVAETSAAAAAETSARAAVFASVWAAGTSAAEVHHAQVRTAILTIEKYT